jgi:hypothetical protein
MLPRLIAPPSRNQTTAPAAPAARTTVPGKLTIAELTIDDCCAWRRGTLKSSIVNDSIINWPATPEAIDAWNIRGLQRNGLWYNAERFPRVFEIINACEA